MPTILHYLNPSTAPTWVAAIVVLILAYLVVRLVRQIVRAMREVRAGWKQIDDRRFDAIRANHQKLHESDSRSL